MKDFPFYLIALMRSIKFSRLRHRIKPTIKSNAKASIVIGTGPSLANDLVHLPFNNASVDYFCVNDFAKSDYFELIKPRNYILLDRAFWGNPTSVINLNMRNSIFEALNNKTFWPLTLYFPSAAKKSYLKSLILNKNITIAFYNYVGVPHVNSWLYYKLIDTQLFAPPGDNVMVHAVYLSMILGYDPIYFLGVDASWHEYLILDQKDNILKIKMKHFDEVTEIIKYQDEMKTKPSSMAETMKFLFKTFSAFQVLGDYARYKKYRVYNCSSYSWIDSFERQNLKDIDLIKTVQ